MSPHEKDKYGRNIFMVAAIHGRNNTMEFLKEEFPSVMNEKDANGDTALNLAARLADHWTVKFMVKRLYMKPSVKGELGRNPFAMAVIGGKLETMKFLERVD